MNNEVSNDEEMMNNKCVGATSIGLSDFHSRLLADTTSRRKLKARAAFTVTCFPYVIMLINKISTCIYSNEARNSKR
jgi:hypothetical protein